MQRSDNGQPGPSETKAAAMTRETIRQEITHARTRACELLAELQAGTGKTGDVYKQVVGQSSMESALDQTRRLIASYDRLLAELESPGDGVPEIVGFTLHNGALRPGSLAG